MPIFGSTKTQKRTTWARILGATMGFMVASTGAAEEFTLDWNSTTWTAGDAGPTTITLVGEFGSRADVVLGFSGPLVDHAGAPTPSKFTAFGGNLPSLAMSADAAPGAGGLGDNTVTATLGLFSQGQALPVNSLEYQIYSIDPQDQKSGTDHCDFVTISGAPFVYAEVANPTYSIATNLGSLLTPLDVQVRCDYGLLLGSAPSSNNSNRGTLNVQHPAGISSVTIQYDEAIDLVRPTLLNLNDPSPRAIGVWGDLRFDVPQEIDLEITTDQVGIADVGDLVTYSYRVTNLGPLPINSDQEIRIIDPRLPVIECPTISARILPGQDITCTGSYEIGQADIDALSLTNLATAELGLPGQTSAERLLSPSRSVTLITNRGQDRGDAPFSFLQARHNIVALPTIYLGATPPDADELPYAGTSALGDDTTGIDDEDGVIPGQLTQGVLSTIVVNVTGPGYLSAWMDFDSNGLFAPNTTEEIARDLRDDGTGSDRLANDGKIEVDVYVPNTAIVAQSFGRFRWSSATGLSPSDIAPDGEVEDHSFVIVAPDLPDRGDAPASYGDPTHYRVDAIYLGATPPDSDPVPIHSATADADDLSGVDDDDDIVFAGPIVAGQSVRVTIETHETLGLLLDQPLPPLGLVGVTNLQMFVDFDRDGVFSPEEHVAVNYRDGDTGDLDGAFNNSISFDLDVPADALGGPTVMRLRWSTTSGISANPFSGESLDGEVSDFLIPVQSAQSRVSGRIFMDNGASAHDGVHDGDEASSQNARIEITNGTGAVIATATPDAAGDWSAALPVAIAGPVTVRAIPLPGTRIISEASPALPGGVNPSPYDGRMQFSPAAGGTYDGLNFGVVAEPDLTQDQQVQVSANTPVLLRHTYRATSTGQVLFRVANLTPAGGQATATLFTDPACNGVAGDVINGPQAVVRDMRICLLVRVVTSADASLELLAETAFTGTTQTSTDTNTDRVEVQGAEGQLTLTKTVQNITMGTGEGTENAGQIGDLLEYRIYLRNDATAAVRDVSVWDQTPPYTALAAPIETPRILQNGNRCDLETPVDNAAGYQGPLKWVCSGLFAPGQQDWVGFQVTITP